MAEATAQRVDFYVLGADEPERVVCRLVDKAYAQGHTVYILVQSQEQAERLDGLLWSFRQDSFIGHEIDADGADSPVRIGWASEPRDDFDVLVNLTPEVPPFHQRFVRVAELVCGDGEQRTLARERFRYYRQHGCEVHSHDLQRAA